VFTKIGCAGCHVPTLETGASPIAALHQVEFHPHSDFLLHKMGTLGDRVQQDKARRAGDANRAIVGSARA
jgi:CxxC motif-containing protein (DUF1111 family)